MTALIEAHGLSAGYGGLPIVRDLELSVSAGELVALLGPNGAGKTTTILTLCGEIVPLSGEVRWMGSPDRRSLSKRARAGLALITEDRSVITGLTVTENLRLGHGADQARALELFPELEEHLHRKVALLSGGQQQMLAMARALAGRPKALLVDELSLGLAPKIVDRLAAAVRRAADEGVAVVMVEQHVQKALEIADRAYVLRRGRCVLEAPASEMAARIDELERSYLGGGPA
jgi:ABC-type branched-subunit amino acid transport system ATPase component